MDSTGWVNIRSEFLGNKSLLSLEIDHYSIEKRYISNANGIELSKNASPRVISILDPVFQDESVIYVQRNSIRPTVIAASIRLNDYVTLFRFQVKRGSIRSPYLRKEVALSARVKIMR
jgi:hypothetical protein